MSEHVGGIGGTPLQGRRRAIAAAGLVREILTKEKIGSEKYLPTVAHERKWNQNLVPIYDFTRGISLFCADQVPDQPEQSIGVRSNCRGRIKLFPDPDSMDVLSDPDSMGRIVGGGIGRRAPEMAFQ